MKRLITTNETATSWSPYKAETKKFQQDMNSEVFAALIQAIVGSTYSTSVPYVVDGCVISGGGPYSITAGKIFYGGEYYSVPSASGLTGTMEFKLENSATAPADPTRFSDGTNHDIHLDYHYTPKSSGTAGTDFSATDLVYLNRGTTVVTTNSSNGQTITVTSSSGTFTYTSDTYTYSYYVEKGICHINFEISFTVTGGATVSKFHLPLPTGITKLTSLTAAQAFKGSASLQAPGGTTNYLTLQSFSNDGGGEGQRFTLRRISEGDTDMTISTVATTLRGEIRIMV